MKDYYNYFIEYDEEANGYAVYAYDPFYHQFMYKGIFDNEDEAKEFAEQVKIKRSENNRT